MARIALGSNVKEGPRRGKVVGHRPKGMVDVQFEDVEWVERRQESNLRKGNPAPDTYDPTMEQWRRQVLGIYKSERERGSTPLQAKKDAFRIAGGVTVRDGRRKKGKMEATAKGRRGAKAKLESPDAWRKRQEWEMFLAIGRKSGKHRVVPQRHGRQTRYYVQPGGRYFYGKGAKKRAESLRDELNGVSMPERMKMAANPAEYELRENWLPAAAAALTIADVGYRAVRDRKKGKKKVEKKKNSRHYSDEGGMSRSVAELRREARNQVKRAQMFGAKKGNLRVKLSQIPRSRKSKFVRERAEIERQIDHVDQLFRILKGKVQDEISTEYYGRLSKDQYAGLRRLTAAFQDAERRVLEAHKRKQAAKKARRSKANPKMYAGISGLGYYWATVRSMKPGEYIAPMILTDRDPKTGKVVYYFVFESKNKRRVSVLQRAAKAAGLRGTSMRSELEGEYKQRKRGQEPLYIFKTGSLKRAQELAIDLQSRNIGYKVEPPNLFGKLARKSVPKRARKPTGLEQKSMAELVARREALLAKRAKKKSNPMGTDDWFQMVLDMPELTAAEKKEARREVVHRAVDRIPFSSSGSRRWKYDEPRGRMKAGSTGIVTFDLPYRSREEKEYLKGSDPVTAYMDTKFERDRRGIVSRVYTGAGVITKNGKKVELVRGGDGIEHMGFMYMAEALEHKMKVRYQGYKGPEKRRMRGTRKRNTYPSHSHRKNTPHGVITRKADLKRDEQYTIWLKMPSGGYVIERSYPGGYIKDAMWNDIKAFNKTNTRQYVVVGHGIDPNDAGYYRKNFVGSVVRGGMALAKTKMGKAIIAETAVVAAVMIGDKLVQKGKISPKVMTYIQGRVEQSTGVKPSKAEVTKVLSAMDKNKDKNLTDEEVIEALELMQKRKKK